MNLAEIENLSFVELKAKREEFIAEAAKATQADLAARYVQARTDAKHRDEKLAEQATTIAALTTGNNALLEKLATTEGQLRTAIERCKRLEETLERRMSEAQEEITKRDEAISQGSVVIDRTRSALESAESLARARRTVLATIMQTISPLLAAE
jgi:chromosome segregation ATPase